MHGAPPRPRYCIMDPRALRDVDRALIFEVQIETESLDDLRQSRNAYWPGYPIVNMETWSIVPETARTRRSAPRP